jgi:hypothetical protein
VESGPLHHADHHGDFVVVTDADLRMGVPGGAEGAQVCDVLLKFGLWGSITGSGLAGLPGWDHR